MPKFTVETTYDLPVYRQVTYEAANPAEACEIALEDDNWESAKQDYDSSGATRVTGIWLGEDAAYSGEAVPTPLEPLKPTYEGIREIVQQHFDDAAWAVVGDRSDRLAVPINAAVDILAKALLQIRMEKDAP